MDKLVNIDQINTDGRRLLEVARGHLDTAVPTCELWLVRDLVGHMGWVHGLVGEYVQRRATEPLKREELPQIPDDDSVMDFAAAALDTLLEGLSDLEPETPIWNWSPNQVAGFYFRRMLHETSVHRWDAENAVGAASDLEVEVDGDQGRDGIDEFFDFVIPNAQKRKKRELPTGSLHLHRTDGEGEWLVTANEAGEVSVERIHAKGDAAIRGPGGALFLALWNRTPLNDLDVFGDQATAQAWTSLAP